MEASADRRLVAGRYVLGGPLGRGGMGTVWRADDTLLGRPVAVKEVELPTGAGAAPEALRERALHEARAAARLNHPGVVTLHDAVEADGRLFLVMELVLAPTLRELVDRSGPLTPAAAARAGLQLVDALEAAHAAGIVHHDVKPANVMVTPDGRVKLADFGIASLQEDTQRTLTGVTGPMGAGPGGGVARPEPTAVFGSLPYVAPEQAAGRTAGPAADLWALGATLWFAVEGAAPFERGHPAATLAAILSDPPGHPAHAGPLTPVLVALLDKDPSRRPTTPAVRRMLTPVAAATLSPTVPVGGSHIPTVPIGGAPGTMEPQPWLPGPPIREGSPAGRAGRGVVHSPPGQERWGVPGPAPRRARRGRVQLPGWTAPPGRRRRGRWLLGAAVLLLLLAVASNLDDRSRENPAPAGLGDPVRDGQFEFVVRSVDCGVRSVGEGFGRRTALGRFCLVRLRVENTGTVGRTFGGGQQYLFDRDGNRHDPDLAATLGSGGEWSAHLNPGQRLAGTLVYDVPESAVPTRVELHDAPFSGGASVVLD
jgi:eukaryotic-like serine/threonine-protein kinase